MNYKLTEKSLFLFKSFDKLESFIKFDFNNNSNNNSNNSSNNYYLRLQKIIYNNFISIFNFINKEACYNFSNYRNIIYGNDNETNGYITNYMNYSKYLDSGIIKFIKKNIPNSIIIKYKVPFNKTFIKINFNIYKNLSPLFLDNLDKMVENMFAILILINNLTNSSKIGILNKKDLTINLFLTHFKKKFDKKTNILGAENINTGFAFPLLQNGIIFIYREEEFFKVFIHESLHISGLDLSLFKFDSNNKNINNILKKLLDEINLKNVNDLAINECLTEFWTNYIYTSLLAFNYKLDNQYCEFNKYNKYFERLFNLQIIFSLFQCYKILYVNNISYNLLLRKYSKQNNYNEKTHAISYYLFKFLLIYDYKNFIKIIYSNIDFNNIDIKLKNYMTDITKFIEYIKLNLNNQKILESFKKIERCYKILQKQNSKDLDFLKYNLYMYLFEFNQIDN